MVRLLRRILAIAASISALVAAAACVGPGLRPGLFTSDALVVAEMYKILPLLFLLILPHPLTMCFEGVLLAWWVQRISAAPDDYHHLPTTSRLPLIPFPSGTAATSNT